MLSAPRRTRLLLEKNRQDRPVDKRIKFLQFASYCSGLFSILLLAAASSNLCAQVTTADVIGTVTDATGAVVGGAALTIVNAGTGATRTTTTSSGGDYGFSGLDVGSYSLTVKAKGFADFEARDIRLAIGGLEKNGRYK